MVDHQQAEALLTRYLAACESRDLDAIGACFARHAVVQDPTSPRTRGRRQIRAYFAALYDDLADLSLQTSPLYWQGDAIACHWQGVARRTTGEVITYEGVDVFHFSRAPLIARLQAFWDPKDFVNAIPTM